MKKTSFLLILACLVFACNEEVKLNFETQNIERSSDAIISIKYPKAIGTKDVSKKINTAVESAIVSEMNITEDLEDELSLKEAVSQFNQDYKSFKADFDDSEQKWEVKVEGELVHESAEIICISLESYIDTGGAHGNSKVSYLNFDPQTGNNLDKKDIFKNISDFKETAKLAFKKQTEPEDKNETMDDFFFGEEFQLPANIGFDESDLILLYNNYEIASYAQGITKIMIPYEQIKDQLKITP